MSKNYSYDDIEKLSQKIQKIKKKKNLEEIRDIIINNNPKLNITQNSYGIYLCFNELSNDTFIKLDKYIKKYFESENINKTTSEFNYANSSVTEEDNNFNYENNSRLKFSNKEKNLIKKRLYDKALQINSEVNNYENNVKEDNDIKASIKENKENNENNENTDSNNKIFLKKNKKIDK
jgi:hypothetical protein